MKTAKSVILVGQDIMAAKYLDVERIKREAKFEALKELLLSVKEMKAGIMVGGNCNHQHYFALSMSYYR